MGVALMADLDKDTVDFVPTLSLIHISLDADGSYTLMHADGTIDLGGSDRLAILLDPSSSAFKQFENDFSAGPAHVYTAVAGAASAGPVYVLSLIHILWGSSIFTWPGRRLFRLSMFIRAPCK